MPGTRRAAPARPVRAASCCGALTLAALMGACNSNPDVVGRTTNAADAGDDDDGGALPADAGRDEAGLARDAAPWRDATTGRDPDAALPPSIPIFTGTTDAGTCDFSDALKNAGLGPELWVVALTCRVPLWWFTQGITGIDQREILRILLGETAVPSSAGRTPDMCDMTYGVFYYDDPLNPANVILCNSVCEALRERLRLESDKIGCVAPESARPDAG